MTGLMCSRTVLCRGACGVLLLVAFAASAELQLSRTDGFIVTQQRTVVANANEVFAGMTEGLPSWWDADHSFSGDADNLRLDRDCLCEAWGNNLVRHLDVKSWLEGDKVIMQGGLGPLQELGLHGTMIWSLAASSERETVVHWKYFVAGVSDADLLALAPVVDAVLGGQIDRLAARFSTAVEQ